MLVRWYSDFRDIYVNCFCLLLTASANRYNSDGKKKKSVCKVVLAITEPAKSGAKSRVFERFCFEINIFENMIDSTGVNLLEQQFQATLVKLNVCGAFLAERKGCTWTVFLYNNSRSEAGNRSSPWALLSMPDIDIFEPHIFPQKAIRTTCMEMDFYIEETKK